MTRSSRLAERFAVRLPPDVRQWIDGEIPGGGAPLAPGLFNQPLNIEDAVWGGLMLPDTLPILDSGCGDVLAMRFASDGSLTEIIRWDHEGNLWQPYGANLAEAVLCDAAITTIEDTESPWGDDHSEAAGVWRWATDWVRRTRDVALDERDAQHALQQMATAGACVVAEARVACERSLQSGLTRRMYEVGGLALAEELGIEFDQIHHDYFIDRLTIPEELKATICKGLSLSPEELDADDFDEAARAAVRAVRHRPDLSWPYTVLGRAAERDGNLREAAIQYATGIQQMGTQRQILGLDEKWPRRRLRVLSRHVSFRANDYIQELLSSESTSTAVRNHWLAAAAEAESSGAYARAYEHYYWAGWDMHYFDDIEQILEGLVRCADNSGSQSRKRIAEHHLRSLA